MLSELDFGRELSSSRRNYFDRHHMDRICFGVQRTRHPHFASRIFSAKILLVEFVDLAFVLQHEPPAALRNAVPHAVRIGRPSFLALQHFFVRLAQGMNVHRALRIRDEAGEFFLALRARSPRENEKDSETQKIKKEPFQT